MTVTNCSDCPFRYSDWNPDSMGADTVEFCTLAMHRGLTGIISVYDSYSEEGTENDIPPMEIPDWCELKKGFITLELKK